jgi:hypothetical protein
VAPAREREGGILPGGVFCVGGWFLDNQVGEAFGGVEVKIETILVLYRTVLYYMGDPP